MGKPATAGKDFLGAGAEVADIISISGISYALAFKYRTTSHEK
jgi:hypothetical protein